MTTRRDHRAMPSLLVALAIAGALVLGGCACTAGPASGAPTAATPGSPDPGAGAGGGGRTGDPGNGGAVGGDPGSGGALPPGNLGPIDPGIGQAQLVTPLPGRANPHPVMPIALQASVDGRHVLVKVAWYGGLEPCSVLDSVAIVRNRTDIGLTPIEGASNLTVACSDIAVLKATIVDLGDLDPGTWHISSPGSDVRPLEIVIG